jgi:hypothetical protein
MVRLDAGPSRFGSTRQALGVTLLAVSIIYSAIDLGGWLRPLLLRWRAHGGIERTAAIVFGSLLIKAIVLFTGAVLAFWPKRQRRGPA